MMRDCIGVIETAASIDEAVYKATELLDDLTYDNQVLSVVLTGNLTDIFNDSEDSVKCILTLKGEKYLKEYLMNSKKFIKKATLLFYERISKMLKSKQDDAFDSLASNDFEIVNIEIDNHLNYTITLEMLLYNGMFDKVEGIVEERNTIGNEIYTMRLVDLLDKPHYKELLNDLEYILNDDGFIVDFNFLETNLIKESDYIVIANVYL